MYNTVKNADEYIRTHYTSGSQERTRWGNLSDEDKTIYLTNACEMIKSLKFPYITSKDDENVPQAFKFAEIELALCNSDEKRQFELNKRKELIKSGVKSFSIGDLSENYGDTSKSELENSTALRCDKCREFLLPYLCGGFEIC